ncbi:MAG: trypsin-like peptidase domain-containing protein [Limnobacter sp.]|nr:trypsin-like peptidase domain-containing protein [Limnobacter sp.]
MLKKIWLTFAQATAVFLALYFILEVLRPTWLPEVLQPATHKVSVEEKSGIHFRNAVTRATPAVVNIFTSKSISSTASKHPFFDDPEIRKFFGEDHDLGTPEEDPASSLGSGVIVSAEGYVLTNQHVVESADEIEVNLADGRAAKAELVGTDPETDLAVLRIRLDNLPSLQFAKIDSAQVGDVVLAIGNPFGVGQTVTMGIVSAIGRNHVGINTFENFIQTDAAINPGNSGGALVDTEGNLLGINTAIYSRSGGSLGIGFAIPGETVRNVLDQIVKSGAVTRGYIGVEQQNISTDLIEAFNLPQKEGVIIAGIVKDGPADLAGLKVGDILLSLDGKKINDTSQMLNLIANLVPGEKKKVQVLREGKKVEIIIQIGTRPRPKDLLKK